MTWYARLAQALIILVAVGGVLGLAVLALTALWPTWGVVGWPWPGRVGLVLALLTMFYTGLANGVLVSDPGRWYAHHALLLCLLLLPPEAWGGWAHRLAWVGFLDDTLNHACKRYEPTFESPLHRLGYPAYWLRDQVGYRLPEGRLRDFVLTL